MRINLIRSTLTLITLVVSGCGVFSDEPTARSSTFAPSELEHLGAIIAETIKTPSQRQIAIDNTARLSAENSAMIERLSSFGVDIRDSERGVVINLPDVLFKTGSAELASGTIEILAEISQSLKLATSRQILVEGHTDNIGSIETNHRLSEARAHAVAEQLHQNGIPPQSVTIKALGETTPIATNRTAEGRLRNRRVEIILASTLATTQHEVLRLR
jgi:outer membrane protein OmpA-like peptidoglycan-associated protein